MSALTTDPVIVETLSGRVAGERAGAVSAFRGIPFAAPPVGPLRFEPPVQPAPWAGVRSTVATGPIAPQVRGPLDQYLGTGDQPIGEDCLTLNVWTPACDDGRRPVLVWIHGGAFVTGAASAPWYDGAAMAANGDVVVVTANYRLGALGFTYLADHGGGTATGNLGLLDQLAALQWVQDHAARFGGNPADVTIFGESAGGTSVVALLAAPDADALFHKAVIQSASFSQLRSAARAGHAAAELLERVDLLEAAPAARLERLRSLPVDELLAAQQAMLVDPMAWFTAFSPVADGVVLPPSVGEVLDAAARRDVPVLIGTVRDEMQLFTALDPAYLHLDDEGLATRAASVLGEAAPAALAAYRAARPGATPGQLAAAVASDHGFRLPAIRFAEARLAAGRPTWMYLFTWPSPTFGGLLGACHGIELPFVFHNLAQPGVELLTGTGAERVPLADAVQAAWLRHARAGDPGWPGYDLANRPTMRFDMECGVVDDPEADLRKVWTPL